MKSKLVEVPSCINSKFSILSTKLPFTPQKPLHTTVNCSEAFSSLTNKKSLSPGTTFT